MIWGKLKNLFLNFGSISLIAPIPPAHVLILDEPTNDLDVETFDVLSDYNQWLDWYQASQGKNSSNKIDEGKKSTSSKSNKKLSFKEIHELQNIESIILDKESTLRQKQQELSQPEVSSNFKKLNELTLEISKLEPEIQKLYSRWEVLEKNPSSYSLYWNGANDP